MKYLQCSTSVTQADDAEQAWLDARAVSRCQFDLEGHLSR